MRVPRPTPAARSRPRADFCVASDEGGTREPRVPRLGDTARAMSEKNIEIVRGIYEAAASDDSSAVYALYDPAVEWDASRAPMPRLIGGGRVFHGHDGLRRFFRERNAVWGEIEDVPRELIDAGEHVVSVDTERGRGRSSGVEAEMTQYAVWTIRKGKVVRVVWFPSRAEALEAAGLSE